MKTVVLLYVGLRVQEAKHFDAWINLTGQETINDGTGFSQPVKPHLFDAHERLTKASPGQIFSFTADEGDGFVIHLGSAQYLGLWLNAQDVAKWQAIHSAILRSYEMAEACKKEGTNRFDLDILRPFRDAYRQLDSLQRQMLLAQMFEYITQPKKKKRKKK